MITALVGPEETPFSVHQEAICDKSKFFRAACSKRWVEGQERRVRLPEVKVEAFRHYCKWIYSGSIPTSLCTPESELDGKVAEHALLVSLYVLGDSLDDVQLRNLTTQELSTSLERSDLLPSPSMYADVWSSTPSGSLFRKQLIDIVVARLSLDDLATSIAKYPLEFLQELVLAAMTEVPVVTWEAATANKHKYLEPEESKGNST
jgi:hypothetical protein